MKYYVLTASEYNNHTNATTQRVVWSLDNTTCIIEVNNDYTITNCLQEFSSSEACSNWRWNPNSEEWKNWASENYWDGSDEDDF